MPISLPIDQDLLSRLLRGEPSPRGGPPLMPQPAAPLRAPQAAPAPPPAPPPALAQQLRAPPAEAPIDSTRSTQPAQSAQSVPDPYARIEALRRYGIIGQLMGVDPTIRAGGALISQADALEQRRAAEAQQNKQLEIDAMRTAAQNALNERRHRENLQQRYAQMNQADYGSTIDFVGQPVLYNKRTGETVKMPSDNVPEQTSGQLPAGSRAKVGFYDMPLGIEINDTEAKYKNAAQTMAMTLPTMLDTLAAGYKPNEKDLLASHMPVEGLGDKVQRFFSSHAMSNSGAQFYDAATALSNTLVRIASGADAPQRDRIMEAVAAIPQPADPPEVMANKMERLVATLQNFVTSTGHAARFYVSPDFRAGLEALRGRRPMEEQSQLLRQATPAAAQVPNWTGADMKQLD